MEELSLLYPGERRPEYHTLPEETAHDLSLDKICAYLSKMEPEQNLIRRIMMQISGEPEVIRYRCDVFEDILRFPLLRERMQKLLDRVDFLKTYGSFGKDSDASGVWELVHRLDEMDEYIECVQAIYTCLNENEIRSEGLLNLKEYVRKLYEDHGFAELKKDIDALKAETSRIKSVTLGVNLNDRFEPNGVGIVSINSKYFTKSGILSNFCDFLNRGNEIKEDNTWNGNYTFRAAGNELAEAGGKMEQAAAVVVTKGFALLPGVAGVAADSRGGDVIRTLDRAISSMLTGIVKKLKNVLSRHVSVSTHVISGLIPEFLYYIRWAEYVEKLQGLGFSMCKPQLLEPEKREMQARGIYNLKLAHAVFEKQGDGSEDEPGQKQGTKLPYAVHTENQVLERNDHEGQVRAIVKNDLDFDAEHRIYILTGANRGGKTTITQAVGIAFLMAQGGIYVPADSFLFSPADNFFTHYPADENQTMDLGRLGEESKRFRDIFLASTSRSLLLLNESFSTTSFEEGFYIARDVVRILRKLGVRTIYNTHMHKLAMELETLNQEPGGNGQIASLVAETEDGQRSYRVRVAPPNGLSYARDIAEKYGVTYEMLEREKYG